MATPTKLFDVDCDAETIIVTPVGDLGEFDYQQLVEEAGDALNLLDKSKGLKNVVIDLHRTDYFGSTALGLFLKLWKRVRGREGHMAFCCVSEHSQEILRLTRLDGLWPICSSKLDALKTVRVA